MKNIILIICSILLLSSCNNKPGSTYDFKLIIKQGDKSYKVKRVQLGEGAYDYIDILYPVTKDSMKVELPKTTSIAKTDGEDTVVQTVVILD